MLPGACSTVDSGHLYVAQCDNYMNTYMHSLLAVTGSVVWSQSFDAQWENYWAPLVVGGRIYFDGGEYGGLYGFDQASGAQDWYAGEEQWGVLRRELRDGRSLEELGARDSVCRMDAP